jgi:hypothetical protein
MPKHKPIKFETTLETSLRKELVKILKENKKAQTTINATLALIAFGGILTFGIIAPGAFSALTHTLGAEKRRRYQEYQELWRNFYKIKKRGDLKFVKEKDGYLIYRPTKKGREKIKKVVFDELILEKPKRWDKKWRLFIFDIPESKKRTRNALRKKLQELGFYQCQKSVWIHPFPCLEEVEFLKAYLAIKPFVKLFVVDEMTDGKVLYHFKNLLKNYL